MTTGLLTNGRYQVLSGVTLPHPGQCAMCSEANRPTVTFSFTIPRYGTFMMCVECFKSCVRDLSPVLGFVSKDLYDAMVEEFRKEQEENDRYRAIFSSIGPDILAVVSDRLNAAGVSLDGSIAVSTPDPEPETFRLFDDDGKSAEDIFGFPRTSTEAD